VKKKFDVRVKLPIIFHFEIEGSKKDTETSVLRELGKLAEKITKLKASFCLEDEWCDQKERGILNHKSKVGIHQWGVSAISVKEIK